MRLAYACPTQSFLLGIPSPAETQTLNPIDIDLFEMRPIQTLNPIDINPIDIEATSEPLEAAPLRNESTKPKKR